MIGRMVSTRSSPLIGTPVRVAISAKARPSAVVPKPTSTARNSVFQATPQRSWEVDAVEPPDRAVEEFLREIRRARDAPALSCERAGEDRRDREEHEHGDERDDDCRSTQPRRHRRGTSPRREALAEHIRKASAASAAPKPMPPWLGPGAPNSAASQAASPAVEPDREALQRRTRRDRAAPASTRSRAFVSRPSGASAARVASSEAAGRSAGATRRDRRGRGPVRLPASPKRSPSSPPVRCQGRTAKPIQPSASQTRAVRFMARCFGLSPAELRSSEAPSAAAVDPVSDRRLTGGPRR